MAEMEAWEKQRNARGRVRGMGADRFDCPRRDFRGVISHAGGEIVCGAGLVEEDIQNEVAAAQSDSRSQVVAQLLAEQMRVALLVGLGAAEGKEAGLCCHGEGQRRRGAHHELRELRVAGAQLEDGVQGSECIDEKGCGGVRFGCDDLVAPRAWDTPRCERKDGAQLVALLRGRTGLRERGDILHHDPVVVVVARIGRGGVRGHGADGWGQTVGIDPPG